MQLVKEAFGRLTACASSHLPAIPGSTIAGRLGRFAVFVVQDPYLRSICLGIGGMALIGITAAPGIGVALPVFGAGIVFCAGMGVGTEIQKCWRIYEGFGMGEVQTAQQALQMKAEIDQYVKNLL